MAVGSQVLASEYNSLWSQLNTIKTRLTGSGQTDSVSAGTVATAAKINTLINATNALRTNTYGQWADWSRTEGTKSAGSLIKELSNLKYTLNYLRDHICARCANCATTTGPMTGNTVRGGTQGGTVYSQSAQSNGWNFAAFSNGYGFSGRNSRGTYQPFSQFCTQQACNQAFYSNGDIFSGEYSNGDNFSSNYSNGWSQTTYSARFAAFAVVV